eukprot:4657536-Pleurochrysis_carterae.AAC.2
MRVPTSTPVVGSSRKQTRGSLERAMAAASLRLVPPERAETNLASCRSRPKPLESRETCAARCLSETPLSRPYASRC